MGSEMCIRDSTQDGQAHTNAALKLIAEHRLSTLQAQQLELSIRSMGAAPTGGAPAERKVHQRRLKELLAGSNGPNLRMDPYDKALALVYGPNCHLIGGTATVQQATEMSEETVFQFLTIISTKFMQLIIEAENESVGARREAMGIIKLCAAVQNLPIAGSERAAALWHATLVEHWGCLLYTSPSPRDLSTSRMPSSA